MYHIDNPPGDVIKCDTNSMNTPGICLKYAQASGLKFDKGKLKVSLITVGMAECIKAVAEVLTFGAQKYAANSWQYVPNARERYRDAMDRHMLAHDMGEIQDSESGLPHIYHAACCMMFLLWFNIQLEKKNSKEP